ncbi:MAG: DUF192 domain-containing protein [Verrucomicrobia bacterium]|nr:DUF192 domain-containing protein [Verrucomicrobiota bacterium]
MRLRSLILLAGFVLGTGAGCDAPKPAAKPPVAAVASELQFHLDKAQPKLATVKLWIGAKEVDAEMCLTRTQIATGLMFRPGIQGDECMLFVFPQAQSVAFYMKNVGFDIDAAYMDSKGVIQQIVRLKKQDVTPVPSTSNDVQFVLETAPGWFEKNGIGVGAVVKTPRRSLREEFGLN